MSPDKYLIGQTPWLTRVGGWDSGLARPGENAWVCGDALSRYFRWGTGDVRLVAYSHRRRGAKKFWVRLTESRHITYGRRRRCGWCLLLPIQRAIRKALGPRLATGKPIRIWVRLETKP